MWIFVIFFFFWNIIMTNFQVNFISHIHHISTILFSKNLLFKWAQTFRLNGNSLCILYQLKNGFMSVFFHCTHITCIDRGEREGGRRLSPDISITVTECVWVFVRERERERDWVNICVNRWTSWKACHNLEEDSEYCEVNSTLSSELRLKTQMPRCSISVLGGYFDWVFGILNF